MFSSHYVFSFTHIYIQWFFIPSLKKSPNMESLRIPLNCWHQPTLTSLCIQFLSSMSSIIISLSSVLASTWWCSFSCFQSHPLTTSSNPLLKSFKTPLSVSFPALVTASLLGFCSQQNLLKSCNSCTPFFNLCSLLNQLIFSLPNCTESSLGKFTSFISPMPLNTFLGPSCLATRQYLASVTTPA